MSLTRLRLPPVVYKLSRPGMLAAMLVIATCALVYLPGLVQATIYRDDWYYVLDRLIGGPGIFQAMFSIDRPARGPFFELYYQLFGIAPLPYHLASFAWRVLGGLAALWLFRLLWPSQPRVTAWMALVFVLFPGYLRWMEGFEDQPRIAGLCLEALSIALTLSAITSRKRGTRIAAWAGSIISGWAYLALVDFALGMEAFRFLCVLVVVSRGDPKLPVSRQLVSAFRAWAAAALIPAGFLFWRLFIFHDVRQQTDVGRQLGAILAAPAATLVAWLVSFVQSAAAVSLFAWVTPVIQDFFGLRARSLLLGGLLMALVVAAILAASWLLQRSSGSRQAEQGEAPADTRREAITIGALGVMAGVVPVVLANRHVDFQSFSHYALPSSLASAVLLVGVILLLSSWRAQMTAIALVACCAVAAHSAYSTRVLDEEQTIAAFWHQVAWRAPSLRAGTTIFVNYPGIAYAENLDAAGGPANMIYFPQATGAIPVTYRIAALRQEPATTEDVLVGKDEDTGYRTHVATERFEQLLVLSRPTSTACVHLIDGGSPAFSAADPDQVRVIGAYSSPSRTVDRQGEPRLDTSIFGPEPPHTWCYYFEKADLARQFGDWQEIARLGDSVAAANLHPEDAVEWLPFLQAYAALGDGPVFTSTLRRLGIDLYARVQACGALQKMEAAGTLFSADIKTEIDASLCRGK